MDTSQTFLGRLRQSRDGAWEELCQLYGPLIRSWGRRFGLGDTDDLLQNVLVVVVKRIETFERAATGSFRAWLREVTRRQFLALLRARNRDAAVGGSSWQDQLDALADPASTLSAAWDREHDAAVLKWLLGVVERESPAKQWAAFRLVALEGKSAADAAAELGTTVNAVWIAKSRVLARVRRLGGDLLDDEKADP